MEYETKMDIIEMARGYAGAILFMILMWTGVVSGMYAGEPTTIILEKDFEYYSIVGNETPIEILLEQNGLNITITPSKYMGDEEFTIIFFNKEKEVITNTVYRGSRGSSSASIKYVDKNVTTYVPVYKNITKETEVEKIVDNFTVLETGYELWMVLLGMALGIGFGCFMVYKKKGKSADEIMQEVGKDRTKDELEAKKLLEEAGDDIKTD